MVVALPSSMTLTKLKIYTKPGNKHAMMPPNCKLGSNHARKKSEEHSTNNYATTIFTKSSFTSSQTSQYSSDLFHLL